MINKWVIKKSYFLAKVLTLPLSFIFFCSLSNKGLEINEGNVERKIRDTIPCNELQKVNWNDVKNLVAANGMLIANLTNGDALIIDRKNYEKFAKGKGKPEASDVLFTKVEIEPEYPGGSSAWSAYVKNNIHFPKAAVNNNIQNTVVVQFIVDDEGNIREAEAVSGPVSGGFRDEAIRLVKMSGKWNPAIQNFRIVTAFKLQPVIFGPEEMQQGETVRVDKSEDSGSIRTESEFPGGKTAWLRYLARNFRYPQEAVANRTQGTIIVRFSVDEKGRIKNITATGAKELRQEAVRLIRQSDRWIPAKVNGQAVKSEREQPITFRFE